jgi:hypothetical protein
LKKKSSAIHLPRKQSHSSFNTGLESVDANYDVIMKADADLILNIWKLSSIFNQMLSIGMAGGLLYRKNGEWILENLTDKDHIRALKKPKKHSNK